MADGALGPHDTPVSAGLRFAVEVVAWVAGPWAVGDATGGSIAAVVGAAAVLVGAPAVFSTPGDKQQVVVATPGPVRVGIEVGLAAVAVAGAAVTWPAWASVGVAALVVAGAISGSPRARWLLNGQTPP